MLSEVNEQREKLIGGFIGAVVAKLCPAKIPCVCHAHTMESYYKPHL